MHYLQLHIRLRVHLSNDFHFKFTYHYTTLNMLHSQIRTSSGKEVNESLKSPALGFLLMIAHNGKV